MFPKYLPFQRAFEAKYPLLHEDYPFAGMVLDKEMRNLEVGGRLYSEQNCRTLARPNPVKAALLAGSRRVGPAKGPSFYIKLGNFGRLPSCIKRALEARGLISFSNQKVLGFSRNRQLHGMSVEGRHFKRALGRGLAEGMDRMAQDPRILAPLDAEIRRNAARMRELMRDSDLRMIVSDGDCMYFSRVMAYVANELGIPFVVIAHGYIGNPYLLSIAPIHCDMLVVWTARQVQSLADWVDPEDARKLQCFGCPKTPVLSGKREPGRVLFIWDPLLIKTERRATELASLFAVFQRLVAAGLTPVLRLHPRDRRDGPLKAELNAAGITTDHDEIGLSLGRADVVTGSFSSALIEAAAACRPVFQFEAEAPFNPESFPSVRLADPDLPAVLRKASGQSLPGYDPFDVDAFCDALCKMAPPSLFR